MSRMDVRSVVNAVLLRRTNKYLILLKPPTELNQWKSRLQPVLLREIAFFLLFYILLTAGSDLGQ